MGRLWRTTELTWIGPALRSSLIALKIGVSVVVIELSVAIAAGNSIRPGVSERANSLAGLGAIVLTFLAGGGPESDLNHAGSSP